MPDRISRPPVRLRGGLPDGNLNGSADVDKHFLKADPDDRYGIVRLSRRQLVHDDETGGDVAVLAVTAIEFPDQDVLQQMLLDHRGQRTGAGTLPFEEAEPENDADKARELQHRIAVWAEQNGLDARQEWEAYFGPGDQAPIGPGDNASVLHLQEFVGERGIVAQPLAAVPGEEEADGDYEFDSRDADIDEAPDDEPDRPASVFSDATS